MAKMTVEKLLMIHAMLQYNPPKSQHAIAETVGYDDTTVGRYARAIDDYMNKKPIMDTAKIDPEVIRQWVRMPINKELYAKFGDPVFETVKTANSEQAAGKETVIDKDLLICRELSRINETLDMIQRAVVALVDAWKGSVS